MASVDTGGDSGQQRGRKKNKWQQRKRLGFHIDMTPYVDVIMLLLTFFIMTSTLNQPQVMQINLPKGEEIVKVDMGNVVYIRVSEKGNIGLSKGKPDGTEDQPVKVNLQQMKQYIEGWGQQNKDMIMILKFHRKAKYDLMISILDEINRAAIEKRYSFSKIEDPDLKVLEAIGG